MSEEVAKATERWKVEHRKSSKRDWVEIASSKREEEAIEEYRIEECFLARVKARSGALVNLGRLDHRRKFESARFDFTVEIPCHIDAIEEVREAAVAYSDEVVMQWIKETEGSFDE